MTFVIFYVAHMIMPFIL